jgi:hypothetical protein
MDLGEGFMRFVFSPLGQKLGMEILPESAMITGIDGPRGFPTAFVGGMLDAGHGWKSAHSWAKRQPARIFWPSKTTRPATSVVFTRPVRVWPFQGELLDLLKPALAL